MPLSGFSFNEDTKRSPGSEAGSQDGPLTSQYDSVSYQAPNGSLVPNYSGGNSSHLSSTSNSNSNTSSYLNVVHPSYKVTKFPAVPSTSQTTMLLNSVATTPVPVQTPAPVRGPNSNNVGGALGNRRGSATPANANYSGTGGGAGTSAVVGGGGSTESARESISGSTNQSTSSVAASGHNDSEKKYRNNINSHFQCLRAAVPTLRWCDDNSIPVESLEGLAPPSKVNKVQILSKSHEYIKHLEQKNGSLQQENEQLRMQLSQFLSPYMNHQGSAQPGNGAPPLKAGGILPHPHAHSLSQQQHQHVTEHDQSIGLGLSNATSPPLSNKHQIALSRFPHPSHNQAQPQLQPPSQTHSPTFQGNNSQQLYALQPQQGPLPTHLPPQQSYQFPKYQKYYRNPNQLDEQ